MRISTPWQNFTRYLLARHFVVIAALLIWGTNSFAQSASATWSLTADAVSVNSGNVNSTNQSSNGVGTNTYGTDGVSSNSWATGGSQNAGKYYQFTITPSVGYTLSITDVSIDNNTSGNSGTALIQYSYNASFTSPINIGSSFSVSTGASATISYCIIICC